MAMIWIVCEYGEGLGGKDGCGDCVSNNNADSSIAVTFKQ